MTFTWRDCLSYVLALIASTEFFFTLRRNTITAISCHCLQPPIILKTHSKIVDANILSVEQTSFAMESVRDTQTMVAAMQTAAKQLKVEHKKININQIEDMQDDLSG